MPALYLVIVSALVAIIAYRTYGAFLAARVATLDDLRVTPAHARRDGRDYVPTNRWVLFGHHFAAIVFVLVVALAAMALVVVNSPEDSSWGVFSILCTIPIALAMGLWSYRIRPGSIRIATAFGVLLLLAVVGAGAWVQNSSLRALFSQPRETLVLGIMAYGFIASVLPVWLLLCPRDYLSSFMKIGAILLLAIGVIIVNPKLQMPALTPYIAGGGPVFPGTLFPYVLITIACGAISGFHALIASGTTPKVIDRESHILPISYGAMVLEGFVGVVALVAACALHPNDYFAINARPEVFAKLELAVQNLHVLEAQVGEQLAGRPGGAVSLAVGMAFPALRTWQGAAPAIVFSALAVAAWGYFVWTGTVSAIWPMLGVSNQLLAAIALAIGTSVLINMGKACYAWTTLVPLAFMCVNTLVAGWMNLRINYLAPQLADGAPGLRAAFLAAPTPERLQCMITLAVMALLIMVMADSLQRWFAGVRGRSIADPAAIEPMPEAAV